MKWQMGWQTSKQRWHRWKMSKRTNKLYKNQLVFFFWFFISPRWAGGSSTKTMQTPNESIPQQLARTSPQKWCCCLASAVATGPKVPCNSISQNGAPPCSNPWPSFWQTSLKVVAQDRKICLRKIVGYQSQVKGTNLTPTRFAPRHSGPSTVHRRFFRHKKHSAMCLSTVTTLLNHLVQNPPPCSKGWPGCEQG